MLPLEGIGTTKREKHVTKEEIKKTYLDPIAARTKRQWHSQEVLKVAVGAYWLDQLGVKDQAKRDGLLANWAATPSSFGTNCSALAQSLGRETSKEKIDKTFAGF